MPQTKPAALPLARDLAGLLRTERFGRALRGYRSVGSTNTVATAWAAAGAPEGAVVVAEYQTAGRGRQGRAWQADAGHNLTFSVILRPSLPAASLGLVAVAAGVAVAEAVEAFAAPLRAAIKWPNDVLLEGRKCCGMLLESTLGGGTGATVVLGIGLNVNQRAFAPPLEAQATSLLLEAGRPLPLAPLLADLLLRLERHYASLDADGGDAARRAYEARLHGLGRETTLRFTGRQERVGGVLLGITDTGALRLRTADGPRTFHAGEVTSSPF